MHFTKQYKVKVLLELSVEIFFFTGQVYSAIVLESVRFIFYGQLYN